MSLAASFCCFRAMSAYGEITGAKTSTVFTQGALAHSAALASHETVENELYKVYIRSCLANITHCHFFPGILLTSRVFTWEAKLGPLSF